MVKADLIEFYPIFLAYQSRATALLKQKLLHVLKKGVITATWNNTTVTLKVPKVSIRKEILLQFNRLRLLHTTYEPRTIDFPQNLIYFSVICAK